MKNPALPEWNGGIGAGDEIRTRDPLVGNEMLYH